MTKQNRKWVEVLVAIVLGFVIGYTVVPWWNSQDDTEPIANEETQNKEEDSDENSKEDTNQDEEEAIGGDDISADYINSTYNFAVNYPDGWQVAKYDKQAKFSNGTNEVDILIKEKTSTQTVDDYYAGKSAPETKTINNLEARHYIDSGYIETEEFTVFNRDDVLFEIHKNFTNRTDFDEIVDSFQLF